VSNATAMGNMFGNTSLSTQNYDALLCGWSQLNLVDNVAFNGGLSAYCNGNESRQHIIDTFDWTIEDGGLDENCNETENCGETEIQEHIVAKKRITTIDILGRDTNQKGFNIEIYDDGSVEKKYVIE